MTGTYSSIPSPLACWVLPIQLNCISFSWVSEHSFKFLSHCCCPSDTRPAQIKIKCSLCQCLCHLLAPPSGLQGRAYSDPARGRIQANATEAPVNSLKLPFGQLLVDDLSISHENLWIRHCWCTVKLKFEPFVLLCSLALNWIIKKPVGKLHHNLIFKRKFPSVEILILHSNHCDINGSVSS